MIGVYSHDLDNLLENTWLLYYFLSKSMANSLACDNRLAHDGPLLITTLSRSLLLQEVRIKNRYSKGTLPY
jgi:hypothetical protein